MRSKLTFHQALFGYDTGHHLLGASLQLSSDLRHLLAVATDLSGSAPPEGFDATYTGLPLEGTNYYAFFCTWLAPEMPRPGCVWSHVLLIESSDFAEIPDLGTLRKILRRPSSKRFDEYETPINFQEKSEATPRLAPPMMFAAEKLLRALYGTPSLPVVLTVNEAAKTEALVFALWSQQWPRLRRTFRFSTGSFADRGRVGAEYDLQISPEVNRRAWQREGEYLLLDSVRTPADLSSEGQPWIAAALDDLVAPDSGGLRSFLREFGADVSKPRSAFALLASAHERLLLHPDSDWAGTLRSVGEQFAGKAEALRLKEWLINPPELSERERNLQRDLATVSFLLASDSSKPYEGVSLDLSRLAQRLWQSGREEVLSMLAQLVRQQERAQVTAFVAAISNVVQPGELRAISEEHPELIPLILGHRPEMAFHTETWQLPTHLQWRIFEALQGTSLESRDWAQIMTAMLFAGTDVAVRQTVERAGEDALQVAFRWLESESATKPLLKGAWRDALANSAAVRLRTGEILSPTRLAFCAWVVPPELARQVLDVSRRDVQGLVDQPLELLPAPLVLHTAFLLVTLALRAGDIQGVKLLGKGFFRVYDALASGNYSSESWLLLAPELPHLGRWSEWDRCKKLRRAARERFPRSTEVLAKTLSDSASRPEHLALARRIWRDFPS